MATELMVKCKGCYARFPVPDQIDEERFTTAAIPTTTLQCPHCRIRRPYDKSDYFFGSGEEELPLS